MNRGQSWSYNVWKRPIGRWFARVMGTRFSPEDLRRELLTLRKGPGFREERLVSSPALVSVLGGNGETTNVLVERFDSAVGSLHDDDESLLRDIYALPPFVREDNARLGLPTTLQERRDMVGQYLGLTRAAIADRDTAAVERLLEQLLTGWYPKSPMGIRVPESHNGFVQHEVHIHTVVKNRRHVESRHHYKLFALFDGVEYLGWASATPQAPVVVGDDSTVRTKEVANGYLHQFWHREPMRRGQTYDLRFRIVNPAPAEEYVLTEESLAFHEPTRFTKFTVTWIGEVPTAAWWFNGLTALERPGVPSQERETQIASDGTAAVTFRDVGCGLFAGIAFDWAEPHS